MKKIEILLGLLLLGLFVLSINNAFYIDYFLIVLFTLSFLYFYLSIYLFTGIHLNKLFNPKSYQGLSGKFIGLVIFAGIAYSCALVAVAFQILRFPGTAVMSVIALLFISIVTLLCLKQKSQKYYPYLSKSSVSIRFVVLLLMIIYGLIE